MTLNPKPDLSPNPNPNLNPNPNPNPNHDPSPNQVDALFDSWDPDGSGELELKELNKLLRRGNVVVELKNALMHGARREEVLAALLDIRAQP